MISMESNRNHGKMIKQILTNHRKILDIIEKSYKNPRKAASQFLNPVSINLKKLPQMPASRFLKIVQETGQIPVCSFYLPVSTSRNHPVSRTPTYMHNITQAHAREHRPLAWYTCTHTCTKHMNTHARSLCHSHAHTQTHKHTNTHTLKHTNTQTHTHSSVV